MPNFPPSPGQTGTGVVTTPAAKAKSSKTNKSGKTMTGEPVDKIVIDPNLPSKVDEAVGLQARVKRAQTMKRYKTKLARSREISRKRLAGKPQLSRRSLKKAKDILRARFAGQRGANYATLAPQDKIAVDKMLDKRKALIKKVADRIYNHVKQDELHRFVAVSTKTPKKRMKMPVMASLEMSFKDMSSLQEKAIKSGISPASLYEVFQRGLADWNVNETNTKQQHAFARVNSFISKGKAYELDNDLHGE